ncbi:hypothetical protein [Microbacterium sp. PM5]|uniref:hypothetical protein n=1 Tax=Microbacterium sp. PM5 TaxID=2014534 RepID=UPI000DD0EEAA|nr:hypothetical protein [Microbacterium sp. PM5]AXA95162.1 hypothetical protein CEP17_01300 [Microbacterium sp. PM5]MDC7805204.1 hypothetical protein [Sphingomonas sp. BLCC-B65]
MKLIPIPDVDRNPQLWVNVDHLVSVMPICMGGAMGIVVDAADLKIDGMQPYRVRLGEHANRAAAQLAFEKWMEQLQGDLS